MNGRFLINRGDAKVMGVAAGLADYTGVDPTIIRLGFVAATLLTGPVMILFYVLAGCWRPRNRRQPLFPAGAPEAHGAGVADPDPHNLQRFVDAQARRLSTRRSRNSRRRQAEPLDVVHLSAAGRPRPQPDRQILRLASLDEARAYLAHPLLGPRLRRIRRGYSAMGGNRDTRRANLRRRSTRSSCAPA